MLKVIPQSSLYRPFHDAVPTAVYTGQSVLRNEPLSFQFVCLTEDFVDSAGDAYVSVETNLPYEIFEVRQVSVMRPTYGHSDPYYARTTPGLYPDPLTPLAENRRIRLLRDAALTLWVTVNPGRQVLDAGEYTFTLSVEIPEIKAPTPQEYVPAQKVSAPVTVRIIDAVLPEQELIYTNWFHCDCLCTRYGCEMFDERHWELIEKYVRLAAANGMNMILTPCFTPPLDTPVGAERMTAQLVDVEKTADGYIFGFDKLRRFLRLCEDCGVRYFEHSHLFTQWGAAHAPKVRGTVDGEYRLLFGWDTDAIDPDGEYADFLRQYLPALIAVLEETGVGNRLYFHISDEPGLAHMEAYRKALDIIQPYIKGYHLFEALSNFEFYRTGTVEIPVPATNHADPFIGNVPGLWLYYTGFASYEGYSNRLISMPGERCRVMGLQMWYHDIKGFLQWAYNFWYTRLSEHPFDPWISPDADSYYVGGTSFMVYPGADGPVPSMRLFNFAEGIDDMRALAYYAERAGRDKADALLGRTLPGFTDSVESHGNALRYCPDEAGMLAFREALCDAIAAL